MAEASAGMLEIPAVTLLTRLILQEVPQVPLHGGHKALTTSKRKTYPKCTYRASVWVTFAIISINQSKKVVKA